MYSTLLFCHSITRWLVLAGLLFAIYRACKGYFSKSAFSQTDNAIRHWTATIAHIQLLIGMVLYFQSPAIKLFWHNLSSVRNNPDSLFFGLFHLLLMLTAITLVTVGSALAKRSQTDTGKFKTMLIWFSISLLIILIAIPWPFSPFANRPYIR